MNIKLTSPRSCSLHGETSEEQPSARLLSKAENGLEMAKILGVPLLICPACESKLSQAIKLRKSIEENGASVVPLDVALSVVLGESPSKLV